MAKKTAARPAAPPAAPPKSSFDPPSDPLDLGDGGPGDFNAAEQRHLDPSLTAAKRAELAREEADLRDRRERHQATQPAKVGSRNRGEQRVHPTSGHGAVHDENTEGLADEAHQLERDNEVTEWVRPSELSVPPEARRPGFVVRWIRTGLNSARDIANLRRKRNEGWRPVKASAVKAEHSLPIIQHDALGDGDYIGAQDLILMEMPVAVNRQRMRFYHDAQVRQSGAIERQVKGVHSESHIGFGAIRRKNVSTIRRGTRERQVGVADDEASDL